jgi:hypothetical protein
VGSAVLPALQLEAEVSAKDPEVEKLGLLLA